MIVALDQRRRPRRRPGTRAAPRSASEQSNSRREAGAADLLHDVGRVGAEHHHLAMRHVDHAHHAEGDGEADGGQQQHRAEADPEDQMFCAAAPAMPRWRSIAATAASAATRTVGHRVRQGASGWPARFVGRRARATSSTAASDRFRRAAASAAGWLRARPRPAPCLTRGSSRSASAASSAGRAAASRDWNTASAASRRRDRVGVRSASGCRRAASMRAPHAVVDPDRLQPRPRPRRRRLPVAASSSRAAAALM